MNPLTDSEFNHFLTDCSNRFLVGMSDYIRTKKSFDPNALPPLPTTPINLGVTTLFPVLLIITQERKPHVMGISPDYFSAENRSLRYMGLMQAGATAFKLRIQPLAVFMLAEAWIKLVPTPEKDPGPMQEIIDRGGSLESFDDKEEVVQTAGLTPDGRGNGWIIPIQRDSSNQIVLDFQQQDIRPYNAGGEPTTKPHLLKAFYQGFGNAIVGLQAAMN